MDHEAYMRKAVSLAAKGKGFVSPNPMVGAVIVKNDRIVATGFHRIFGGPHAERNAILKCSSEDLSGASLYVTLEPCSHHGKTPPCTDIIISSGITSVIVGQIDPNPLVKGKGIKQLRHAGISVYTGVLENQCARLNEVFTKFMTENQPYVTLKIAQTLDGRIATKTGESKWITGQKSRRRVHRLRREHDAVLVGISTVIQDDPMLNVRHVKGSTSRMVFDSRLRIPLKSNIVRTAGEIRTIIVTTDQKDTAKENALRSAKCQVWTMPVQNGMISIPAFTAYAAKQGFSSIMVEGGSRMHTAFLKHCKADRIVVFTAPRIFGSGLDSIGDLSVESPESARTFREYSWKKSGDDMMFDGRL